MGVGDRIGDLDDDLDGPPRVRGALAQPILQAPAPDQLHGEEVLATFLGDAINLHDIRMLVELRDRLSSTEEKRRTSDSEAASPEPIILRATGSPSFTCRAL